ncbi:MAG: CvpA family protein [Burkholderiales bacterium]
MTWFDYAVLAVLALSALIGLWRGFVREVFALGAWVVATFAALTFGGPAGEWLPAASATPFARGLAAGVAIFVVVLIVGGLTGVLLAKALRVAGFGLADRTLGGVFGLARGALICLLAVLVAGLTVLPKEPFWREATLSGPLETAVVALKPHLPPPLAARVRYER